MHHVQFFGQLSGSEKNSANTSRFDGSLVPLKVDDIWPTNHTSVCFLVTGFALDCSDTAQAIVFKNYADSQFYAKRYMNNMFY